MKKISLKYLLLGATFVMALVLTRSIQAQGDSATTVINTINQLRAQKGLPALQSHPALMQSAQQHSLYQASIGTWTHYSADGSGPRDRAIAAGFGNGAYVYVSENVAYGTDMSIMETINGPWNDPEHYNTMFGPNYKYIGAGVAYSGDFVFYTVDTGYWVGDPAPTAEYPAASGTPSGSVIPTAVPVVVSTPLADGTVKHIVAGGQTLWTIAAVYNIPLEEICELNGLEPDAILNVGEEVIVSPSYTPTNTPIGQPSATPPPRFTHTPSPVGTVAAPIQFQPVTPSPTSTQAGEPRFRHSTKNPTTVILAVVISGGTLLTTLFFSLRKKDQPERPDLGKPNSPPDQYS
jgi:LysM repeat protein